MTKNRVVGVIGLGHVGAHVAYSLAVQGIADELVLVDQNQQKLQSEVQDLRDAAPTCPTGSPFAPETLPTWANAMSSSTARVRSTCSGAITTGSRRWTSPFPPSGATRRKSRPAALTAW